MLKIDPNEKQDLVNYFNKNVYNTIEILKDNSYSNINSDIKDFLLDLDFEENGIIKENILFMSHQEIFTIVNDFFENLENCFGNNAKQIFLNTSVEISCSFSTIDNDEKIKCIKKFISRKYNKMYKNFRTSYAKKLIEYSDMRICPYCNRNYINIIENENRTIIPDLDHFYPKSKYPFLSVVLSNLVPSCLSCNERIKGSIDFYSQAMYPPNKLFGIIEFDFDIYLNKIYLKNYESLDDEYKVLVDTFLIQESYATHTEILKSITNKYLKYKKSKLKDIANYAYGLTENEMEKIVFYEYEFLNKKTELLYKLKKDLYEKIGGLK